MKFFNGTINVKSFLVYFILIHVCMAEEPSRGGYAIKYVCMYVCTYKRHFVLPHAGRLRARARALAALPPKFPRTCKSKRSRRLRGTGWQGWGYR